MTSFFLGRSGISIRSLDKFVVAVQEGGGTYVTIHPYLVRSAGDGNHHPKDYKPVVVFRSETRDGRPIVFKETYPDTTHTLYGKAAYHLGLRTMLTIADRLQTIRRHLPADDLDMAVMGRTEPLNDQKFQAILARARNYNLAPF